MDEREHTREKLKSQNLTQKKIDGALLVGDGRGVQAGHDGGRHELATAHGICASADGSGAGACAASSSSKRERSISIFYLVRQDVQLMLVDALRAAFYLLSVQVTKYEIKKKDS